MIKVFVFHNDDPNIRLEDYLNNLQDEGYSIISVMYVSGDYMSHFAIVAKEDVIMVRKLNKSQFV